ncbi:MAG TPA: amidohydrolase family protein [Rubrobacter sp.]|nr:amidohydrolase family protein [Rubrobacter sp.]
MSDLLLTNARVLDGLGEVFERATVSVTEGLVAGVDVGERSGREEIDLSGKTLMPALVDAHVHLSSYETLPPLLRGEEPRSRALPYFELANFARNLLAMGVLTVRDVGSMDDHALHLRQAIRLGLCIGPRILTCARIISATSPGCRIFTTMYRPADGPEEVRKAVREQVAMGADFVKIMATGARSVMLEDPEPAQLTREEVRTVVEEAHRLGKRVAAHAEGLGGARIAVEEGVDTIEHGLSLHRAPELLEKMAECGQTLVPTLSTFHDVAEDHAEKYPCALVEQARRQREEAYESLLAARGAGVRIAMGFDSYPLGENARELVRMVDGGLTPMEGIVAATSGSAAALGLDDLGKVQPGAVADLIAVDGDPLSDPAILLDPGRIHLVLQAGRPVGGT